MRWPCEARSGANPETTTRTPCGSGCFGAGLALRVLRSYEERVTTRAMSKDSNGQRLCPAVFILDVDGVLTDGSMLYTAEGKVMKRFGPDDHDALVLLRKLIPIQFVSGDSKGFPITAKRVSDDMKFSLDLVSTIRRREWIERRFPLESVIYMGDGIFDALVLSSVGYGIAPADASPLAKAAADFVTESGGGNRAVAEACLHIMERFFEPIALEELYATSGEEGRIGT